MSQSATPSSHSALTHAANASAAPIKAEIVPQSIHQSVDPLKAITVSETEVIPPSSRLGLESLLTPWGISSILLFLMANLLIALAQLSPQTEVISPNTIKEKPSPSPSQAILPVKAKSPLLPLNSLSILSPKVTRATQPVQTPILTPSQPTVVPLVTPQPNLASALLPPSLQPQIPVYQMPNSGTVATPTREVKIVPSATVRTLPPPPPIPTPVAIETPVTAPSEVETSKAQREIVIQQTLEQQQQQENIPPLGFSQETRLKMQAAHNQQNPHQLIQQFQEKYPTPTSDIQINTRQ